MKVMDLITPASVRAPLRADTKRGAIDELIDLIAEQGLVKDAAVLKEAVWAREQTRTTGIGHGLAIPHGKGSGVSKVVMAIGKPAKPLEFEALDGQPVRLIALLASPPDRTGEHIQALARVSKLMTPEDFRRQIYAANTADDIYQLLKQQDESL